MQQKEFEEGSDNHIKGFILNKLYLGGYFSKRGKKHHGRHTSVKNLPKGYPKKHRRKFIKNIKELRKDNLIMIFPSAGDRHVCAVLDSERIEHGIVICNTYRESVGLPPLDKRFREIIS